MISNKTSNFHIQIKIMKFQWFDQEDDPEKQSQEERKARANQSSQGTEIWDEAEPVVIQGVLGRGADREEKRGKEGGLDTGDSEGWRTKAILCGVKEYGEAASLLLVAPDGGISDRAIMWEFL